MADRFKFNAQAQEDLENIGEYTQSKWGTRQRKNYLSAIRAKVRALSHFPKSGDDRSDIAPGMRSAKAGKHLLFYHVAEKNIVVSRVLHESMDTSRQMRKDRTRDRDKDRER